MNDWLKADMQYNWHPYTQMSSLEVDPPVIIDSAKGIKLYDSESRWYYDTISSWWCNVHGHGHPRIVDAVKQQLDKLDHTLFAAITHKPAIELSEKLVRLAPEGLQRVFYSDNGSTAVEIALKMSVQYWRNSGKSDKTGFISLDHGYHGDTIGCMSVSAVDLFVQPFTPLMFHALKVPSPYCYRCPLGLQGDQCDAACASFMEDALRKNAETTAAIIMEPILMGAGGMIVYPAAYVARVSQLARKYGVHLILDEVATGFGRTGTMFACEQAGVSPNFLCISKGLTGGMLPLAATLTTSEVFDAFQGPVGSDKTFYHGHTYTANPIGCAAANASLVIYEEENVLEHVKTINAKLQNDIQQFAGHPLVGDIRVTGTIAALELVKDKTTKEPFSSSNSVMRGLFRRGLDAGIILRPIGNAVYLFLPLCTTSDELDDILARMHSAMSC
ncbi:MAG: adenosylmethionine--8-amino-7-oxononanoate transaminase [Armatimonadota bacterium]